MNVNGTVPSRDDESSWEHDPLLDIIGLVDDGSPDMAERHDDYLAEMIARENSRPSSPYTENDDDLEIEQ